MKLSKYIIQHTSSNGEYWLNTINGMLIKISQTDFWNNQKAVIWLKEQHFIVEDNDNEISYIAETYQNIMEDFDKVLYITTEITTGCNFKCAFCYQAPWDNRKVINKAIIDRLITILSASDTDSFEKIHLNIIGGEPLLYMGILKYLLDSIGRFASSRQLAYEVKLNSNGYNLSSAFIRESLPPTVFMFPFLSPIDYSNGLVRLRTGTNNLRKELLSKIPSWKEAFNEDPHKMIIFRYNVNEYNLKYFDRYVDEIVSFGFKRYLIEIVNTADCDFNHYRNLVSKEDFDKWYYDVAMPILINKNLPIPIKPRCELSRCKARRKGSFKVFADGRIGLCNGIEYDSTMPMIFNIESLADIDVLFDDIKNFHYIIDDNMCMACDRIFLCGGPSPCKGRICRGNKNNVKKYIDCHGK